MAYTFDENDIDDEDRDFFEEYQDDIFDGVKNMLKICCFSEDYRSFPMWDHYANGYRGVCIEYNTDKLKECKPIGVKYSNKVFNDYPKGARNDFEFIITSIAGCILTKNKDYSHEKEWRYFTSVFTDDYVDIGDAINCVYIGDRCHRYKNKIAKLCYDNDIDVVFLKTSKNKFDFEEYFSSKP